MRSYMSIQLISESREGRLQIWMPELETSGQCFGWSRMLTGREGICQFTER